MGSLLAENAQRVKGIVRRPLMLQRLDRPVPDQAVRILLAECLQRVLEILLADFEGGFHVDVVGGDFVVPGRSPVIPGLTGNLTSSCHKSHDRRTAPGHRRTPRRSR